LPIDRLIYDIRWSNFKIYNHAWVEFGAKNPYMVNITSTRPATRMLTRNNV